MIRLFGITDTSFSSNGDLVINPLRAKVHKEDNGLFFIDLETNLDYVDNLVEGNIIIADSPGRSSFSSGERGKDKI